MFDYWNSITRWENQFPMIGINIHPILTLVSFSHLRWGNSASSAADLVDDGQSTPTKPSPHVDSKQSSVPADQSLKSDSVADLAESLGALSPPSATKTVPSSPRPNFQRASAPTTVETPGGSRCNKRAKMSLCFDDSDDEQCGEVIEHSAISTSEGPLQGAAHAAEGDFTR